MSNQTAGKHYQLRILESPEELAVVEEIQRIVWPGEDSDIVPLHMLLAATHNGGLVIGAFEITTETTGEQADDFAGSALEDLKAPRLAEIPIGSPLVGFVFGFPGLYFTPDGPRPKHCSHMLGVLPEHRDRGAGFMLKRAQWQMVRHQGLDRITWTYDPLLSRNAHLNIARLGAVCSSYIREAYGQMRDGLNVGLPSDRFQVDWWINSQRVFQRLSKKPRRRLDLAHFLAAGITILNPTQISDHGLPTPPAEPGAESLVTEPSESAAPLVMVEIPSDFLALKAADPDLALRWRLHSRTIFENLFERGYLVTDFVYLPGTFPRSFYVLSHGESTL